MSTAVVSTLALSGLSVLAGTTNAFAANGGQTVAAPATGTLTPTAPATYNPGDLNCQGQCVVGPLAGYSVSISATGFDANSGITVAECQGDKTNATFPEPTGSNGPLQCTTFGDDTSGGANISGTFSGTFNIHTVTAAQGGGAATCDATHLCTLYVGENLGDFTAPHALFDFDFAAPLTPNPPSDPSPQALPVANLGSATITINYGTATDSNGGAETINLNSTIVTGPGAGGTVTATSPGVFKYTDTTGVARTDSFVVGGATATCASCTPTSSAAGQNITVNVTVQGAVAYPNSCDVTAQPSCHLKQIVQIPITPGDLVMSQAGDGTNPIVDILDHTTSGTACTGA
ncbi:MAG TPA: hypothetical protein VNY84_07810, partial [Acidimicrobiales bacterium]|nr:hypothetical protein [Acidimicrobiales bacterium]